MKTYCLLCTAGVVCLAWAVSAQQPAPLSWAPTHSAARTEDYAGTAACASCHLTEATQAARSQMGNSIVLPSRKYLDAPVLHFQRGPYAYTLDRDGDARLTVGDGKDKIAAPIFAMIGQGEFFQSYLMRYGRAPYRGAVDFVTARRGLDLDNEADPPTSLETALGRHHSEKYVRECLSCHSPASVTADGIDFVHRPLGNTCEVCHGSGAEHVALERAGKSAAAGIFNPGLLTPAAESDFCGQCHTTASAMRAEHATGTRSVISEPYRLETSRCWNPDDRRIRCTACHDPHAAIVRDAAAYDRKCEACHVPQKTTAAHQQSAIAMCPVGKHNCAGCHMPRTTVPETPIVYSDHRIRIARAGAPFPE